MVSVSAITNNIVAYLQSIITSVPVAASPDAPIAPNNYNMLDDNGCILVWFDSVNSYPGATRRFESGIFSERNPLGKRPRFVVSIGMKTLKKIPQLDTLVETVEESLTNFQYGVTMPLAPITTSRITRDDNSVYWRQIYFETDIEMKIASHSYEEE